MNDQDDSTFIMVVFTIIVIMWVTYRVAVSKPLDGVKNGVNQSRWN